MAVLLCVWNDDEWLVELLRVEVLALGGLELPDKGSYIQAGGEVGRWCVEW